MTEKVRTQEEINEIRAEIAERYDMVFPNVVLEPVWYGRRPAQGKLARDRFAIVDQNTDTLYNICTDIYKPIYHELIVKMVEEAVAEMPEFGKAKITPYLLADGGKLRIEVKFPEVVFNINPKVGDIVNPLVDIFSSYDLGWKYRGDFGGERLVCTNGMKVGAIFDSFKKRHLTSLDPMELIDTISAGMIRYSDQTALWQRWAEEKMLPETYEQMWAELPFSAPEKEKIEQLEEAATHLLLPQALKDGDLTRWDFYNVLTQYATHEIKSEIRRIEIQPAITRIFEKRR